MEGDKGWHVLVCALFLVLSSAGCGHADRHVGKCYPGVFIENAQNKFDRVYGFESQAGGKMSQVMWFADWNTGFPLSECKRLKYRKYIPHITWEPWSWGGGGIELNEITDGLHDEYLEDWVRGIKEYGGPLFIRWGHEFNGNWYPWSLCEVGPEKYVKTYRYIVDFFRSRGVKNVKWIWCPNADLALPMESYPGQDYVDWIGIDVYNFGDSPPGKGWAGFDKLFYNTYKLLRTRYPGHPIMIAEMSCSQQGGNKAAWIREFGAALKNRYPGVLSFVWFNIKKEADWRVESSAASRNAFREMLGDSRYSGDHDGLWAVPSDALTGLKDAWENGDGEEPDVPSYRLRRKRFDIKVDGVLDEWKKADVLKIDGRGNIVVGPNYWESEKDLSARARIVWDEKGLYFALSTVDDKPFINWRDKSEIWNGDCVELCLGLNPEAKFGRMDFDDKDFQIGFALKPGATRVCVWHGKGAEDGITAVSGEGKKGCDLEAFLPWSALRVSDPKALAGKTIRLNIALDDADESGGGRSVQMAWTGGADFYIFPCLWGKAVIED